MAQPTEIAGSTTGYEIIIEPSRGWLRLNWREIWEYRDLLVLFVRRDFLAKYKQTLLGPLWFILQPLLSAVVMSIAFHKVAGISTGRIPPLLFNLCALLPWSYFAQNVTSGAATFTANAHLFGKVYFPRLLVPLGTVVSNLFAFILQLVVFALFFAWFTATGAPVHLGLAALLAIPLILVVAILSLGVSLLLAASTARFRDFSHLTPVLLQLWMFASPVFYPMDLFTKNPNWSWLAWANPMAPIVEHYRTVLLGDGTWQPAMLAASAGISVLTLLLGVVAFNRAERTVVDSI